MIRVSIEKNACDNIVGFTIRGHAGYDESGKDIVCAAVSMLVINTINSIEKFTQAKLEVYENEKDGYIRVSIIDNDNGANLLLSALELGIITVKEEYEEYLDISTRRIPL